MWTDPIIEEVRRFRDEYAASFDYDLDAIFRDLLEEQDRARREGREIVSFPPRQSGRSADSAA